MTREEIIAALKPLYQDAFRESISLTDAYIQAFDDGADSKARNLARHTTRKYGFINGLAAAAKALGVDLFEIV